MKKEAIVVIGSRGLIGTAFCEYCSANNINVIEFDSTISENQHSRQSKCHYVDISNDANLVQAVKELDELPYVIRSAINLAYPRSKGYGKPLELVNSAEFNKNLGAHLGGFFNVMRRFGEYFCHKKAGNVVSLSSIYGSIPPKFQIYENTSIVPPVEYSAIKGGIENLNRFFAAYYKKQGVRYNCLAPGGVLNNQPVEFINAYNEHCGKIGMLPKEDLCEVLGFLISDSSKFINGQVITVDDGFSI